MRIHLSLAVAVFSTFGLVAPAMAASIDQVVLSAEKGARVNQTTFARDTPLIYVSGHMADPKIGSKVTVSWISLDSHGAAPPNYKIDAVDIPITGAGQHEVDSSLSKPDAGWPVGTYEVDFAVDGQPVAKAEFSVQ